ncbi:MAG: hypothetical protein CUN56_05380, partial [Phototrophicales bacterium]
MYRLFFVLLLVFPTWAQDNITDTGCTIDLSPIAAQLIQAQAHASQGDTTGALSIIADIQAQLDALTAACEGQESSDISETTTPQATPQASQTILLSGYQFDLPADWLVIDDAGVTLAGPTDGAARAIIRPNGLLRQGEQAVAIVIGDAARIAPELTPDATAQEIITLYRQTFEQDFNFSLDNNLSQITINNRESWRFRFNAPGYSGLVNVTVLDNDTLMLIIVAASVDEIDSAESILNTILGTIDEI